jgi:hypothetical protein
LPAILRNNEMGGRKGEGRIVSVSLSLLTNLGYYHAVDGVCKFVGEDTQK